MGLAEPVAIAAVAILVPGLKIGERAPSAGRKSHLELAILEEPLAQGNQGMGMAIPLKK